MNWNQINASATPEEQIEVITLMLRTLQTRHSRRIFARGRLIYERRRLQAVHYIGERRGRFKWSQTIIPLTFGFTLLTVTAAAGLSVLHAPAEFTAPMLFFYLTSIWAVLAFKPRRLHTHLARS